MLDYEEAVRARYGMNYRAEVYRKYRRAPKARAWLDPESALEWFRCFRDRPEQLIRPKKFADRSDA